MHVCLPPPTRAIGGYGAAQELKESHLSLWEFFMNDKLQELQQFRDLVVSCTVHWASPTSACVSQPQQLLATAGFVRRTSWPVRFSLCSVLDLVSAHCSLIQFDA
jgi:hypothetical protein